MTNQRIRLRYICKYSYEKVAQISDMRSCTEGFTAKYRLEWGFLPQNDVDRITAVRGRNGSRGKRKSSG